MRFITLQVALFSVQWYFVQACSSMHFILSIDKHRLKQVSVTKYLANVEQ